MTVMTTLSCVFLLTTLAPAAARAADDTPAQLKEQAFTESRAWSILESLVTEVGARPVGSPGMARARDWAIRTLTDLGFENVHIEAFVKENAWIRGAESAAVTAPVSRSLAIAGLGNTV